MRKKLKLAASYMATRTAVRVRATRYDAEQQAAGLVGFRKTVSRKELPLLNPEEAQGTTAG